MIAHHILSPGNSQTDEYGHGDLVLFPPLSKDPNDPLRLPKWRKYTAFSSVCILAFISNFGPAASAPAFVTIGIEFKKEYATVSKLFSYFILFLGISVCPFLFGFTP